ncbi:MAG: alpha/beta fold hydrolase [Anaerolineae bacterium]|nr:alpha/beta fold hydrolase [Anaerolineae bacterium]
MQKHLLLLLILLLTFPILAQDDMMMETVNLGASDGLVLVGDMYRPDMDGEAAAVLLIHMLGSNRTTYAPLIPALLEAGYVVLNVDMRGHGETGGSQDWALAETDIQVWLDWLREQENVSSDAVSIIGASIGGNLALIGCANDAQCLTSIALSPGIDYRGVMPESAVTEGLSNRSALLVASHNDGFSADSVRQIFANATGNVSARLYNGRAHGIQLFDNELESITTLILSWLDEHVAALDA